MSDKYSQNKRDVRLAQLDRAFGYGPKGRGFESSNARYSERLETLKNQWFPAFFCVCEFEFEPVTSCDKEISGEISWQMPFP